MRLRDGLVVCLRTVAIVTNDLVLIAEGLLLGLKQLKVRRGSLGDLMVVLHLEFVGHRYNFQKMIISQHHTGNYSFFKQDQRCH